MEMFFISLGVHVLTVALISGVFGSVALGNRMSSRAEALARAGGSSRNVSGWEDEAERSFFTAILFSPFAILSLLGSIASLSYTFGF